MGRRLDRRAARLRALASSDRNASTRRPAASAPSRRIRGRASQSAVAGPAAGCCQGMWAGGRSQPLLSRDPVGTLGLRRAPLPGGHGSQRRRRAPPRNPIHRTSTLISRDRSRAQLVPVTAPARTLLDLAAIVDGAALRSLVRRAQGLSRVNLRQLHEVLIRLRPRRGSRRLASVIATGPAPTRTVLEDVVLDLLLSGGFEHPDVNQPLRIGDRRLIPDFRWPCERLIVEADGGAWHDEKVAREDDAERQGLLEAHGERVLRVSWNQAVSQPLETLTRIRAAGAPLARSSRATRPEPRRVRGGATGRR